MKLNLAANLAINQLKFCIYLNYNEKEDLSSMHFTVILYKQLELTQNGFLHHNYVVRLVNEYLSTDNFLNINNDRVCIIIMTKNYRSKRSSVRDVSREVG